MLLNTIMAAALSLLPVENTQVVESNNLVIQEVGSSKGKVRIGSSKGKVRIGSSKGKVRIGSSKGKIKI